MPQAPIPYSANNYKTSRIKGLGQEGMAPISTSNISQLQRPHHRGIPSSTSMRGPQATVARKGPEPPNDQQALTHANLFTVGNMDYPTSAYEKPYLPGRAAVDEERRREHSFSTVVSGESSEIPGSKMSDAGTETSSSSIVTNPFEGYQGNTIETSEAGMDNMGTSQPDVCLNFNFGTCRKRFCRLLHKRIGREEILAITSKRSCVNISSGRCKQGDNCMFFHPPPPEKDFDPALLKTRSQSPSTIDILYEEREGDPTVSIVKPKIPRDLRIKYLDARQRLRASDAVYQKKLQKCDTRQNSLNAYTKRDLELQCSDPAVIKLPGRATNSMNIGLQETQAVSIGSCDFCRLGICENGVHFSAKSAAIPQSLAFQGLPITIHDGCAPPGLSKQSADNQQSLMKVANTKRSQPRATSAQSFSGPDEISVTLLKSTRVRVGHGLQIMDVQTSFHSREVLIGNLPLDTSGSIVRRITSRFGNVVQVETWNSSEKSRSCNARVLFSDESEASGAVNALNGSKQPFGVITASFFHHDDSREIGRLSAAVLVLNIPAPGARGYLGFETLKEAERMVQRIHGTCLKSHIVSAQVWHSMPRAGAYTVKFEGLPPHNTEKTLRMFNQKPLERGGYLTGDAAYASLTEATKCIRKILEREGPLVELHFPNNPPIDGRQRGHAKFASADGAAAAKRALHGRKFAFLGHEKIYVHHEHKLRYKIPDDLRDVLLPELIRIADFAKTLPQVTLTWHATGSGKTDVTLTATQLVDLKAVKAPLDRLISGEIVQDDGKPLWDNFFARVSGQELLKNIAYSSKALVRPNRLRGVIKVWGSKIAVRKANVLIVKELRRLRREKCFYIPLNGKFLIQVLFDNLTTIREKLGEENVIVDFGNRRLVIRGTQEQFEWVATSLTEKFGHLEKASFSSKGDEIGCPVCLDSAIDPIELKCGHGACRVCLVRYISSAHEHRAWPLHCLGDGNKCKELLPLPLCQKLVPSETFARLIDASFLSYIQSRADEFHYCPTPDCPQIYRSSAVVSTPQCPTCLVRICTSCHEVEHDGVPCAVSTSANEKMFEEWREQNNVKQCPKCTTMIEKIAGCNHMMCTRCGTHICWSCMETFGESQDVYEHMNKKHGSFGL